MMRLILNLLPLFSLQANFFPSRFIMDRAMIHARSSAVLPNYDLVSLTPRSLMSSAEIFSTRLDFSNSTGDMEDNSETSRSARILAELYDVAKSLSEE